MSLSDQQRRDMIAATRQTAIAFVEDIADLRELSSKLTIDPGRIRRASVTLRRLLLDHDISKISAPRMPARIEIDQIDLTPFYDLAKKDKFRFFAGAGVHIETARIAFILRRSGPTSPINYDQERLIRVRLDNFLSQRVLCFEGDWVSRREVIKYVAHFAPGVAHSGTPQKKEEITVEKIRYSIRYDVDDKGILSVCLCSDDNKMDHNKLSYNPNSIDPLLAELNLTCKLLTNCDDIKILEEIVKSELGI